MASFIGPQAFGWQIWLDIVLMCHLYPLLTLDVLAEPNYKQKPAISTISLTPNSVLMQNAEPC